MEFGHQSHTGRMAIIHEEIPIPRSGEVLVRVTHAGLCGSDLQLGKFIRPTKWGLVGLVHPISVSQEPSQQSSMLTHAGSHTWAVS